MSKPVNPTAIGAFVVGAIVLLASFLYLFGGGEFFKEKSRYVIYFDSSLNGLNIGAPVKLQGVQIGTVREIGLQFDPQTGYVAKPVVIEIDPASMTDVQGDSKLQTALTHEQSQENARLLIDAHLKARLEMQSFLTGLLYVDIDFHPDKPVKLTGGYYKNLPELPSVPTSTDEIRNTINEFITVFRQMPIQQMVNDFAASLKQLRAMLESDDAKKSRKALTQTFIETERLMKTLNQDIKPILSRIDGALQETHAATQTFNSELPRLLKTANQTLTTATQLLEQSQGTVRSVEQWLAPDASLDRSLGELRDAARALKDLTEYLQRHPDAVIYGR